MIEATSVHYKMGNSSNKSPVKVTKSIDPRVALSFISDRVDHAFSDLSPSTPPKKSACVDNSDHYCSKPNSSSNTSTSLILPKVPTNDPETERKIVQSSVDNSIPHCENEKKLEDQEDKENTVQSKVIAGNSYDQRNDYLIQPSTSKSNVLNFIPLKQGEFQVDEKSCGEFDSDDYSYDEAEFDNYDFTDDDQDEFDVDGKHFFVDCDINDRSAVDEISDMLLSQIVGKPFGPRSRCAAPYDSCDSDSDSDLANANNKENLHTQIIPTVPKEDIGELGIPRTQKINKDGNPVEEKCSCHHHQVVSTK